ncbi:MAG: DNA polymerase III subunit chi [Methylobacter sp.]|nr:MAG: DNA polymerase III subunit chi [Methylobacter sp.]PPD30600.1 MAG: DNA polymerase III subunit chi [Methylomonas sp.]
MPEVSFYVLGSHSAQERLLFVCRLAEKAYRSENYCYVVTEDEQQSRELDDLLWTFRQGSFIPHQIHTGTLPEPTNVILIGQPPAPPGWQHTLINLAGPCPESFAQADRILEVVDENATIKAAGRLRYRQYQQAGLAISTHKMSE